MSFFSTYIEALLIVAASSLDAFAASLSYGANKIKIPLLSAIVIDLICTLSLTVALFTGSFIKDLIPGYVTSVICFIIFFIIGTIKLFDFFIKSFITKKNNKIISFHIMDIRFLLQVYCDNTKADYDSSKILNKKEAIALSIALSPDGLATGFGVGLVSVSYLQLILYSLLINLLAIKAGDIIGESIAKKSDLNLTWVSGIILIVLAFLRL